MYFDVALYLNGIIGEQDVMDAKTLPLVTIPNRDGFASDPRPDVGQASQQLQH
jgi:S-disulfanyl-L-cysteine oxidoreductase SoxD